MSPSKSGVACGCISEDLSGGEQVDTALLPGYLNLKDHHYSCSGFGRFHDSESLESAIQSLTIGGKFKTEGKKGFKLSKNNVRGCGYKYICLKLYICPIFSSRNCWNESPTRWYKDYKHDAETFPMGHKNRW